MADAILTGAAANVLSSLGSYAIQHIGLPCGVKGELRKMETNISTINNILQDAQEQQMSNRAVKEWLERLKLILYDAEDLLDEVATETKRRQVESLMRKVHHFFTSSNPLVFRYVVGRKIRDIGKRLDEIDLQMKPFKFVVKLVQRPIQINRREETISFVNPVTVIGRDADKEKLVRLLLSSGDEENVAIIPIVGMGGLGKTTLAQLVYNDGRIQKHFTIRMWVCISNDFDFKRILIKLLQAGGTNGDSNEELEQLQNRVRSLLREHKFLLFLDDVWNEDRVEWKKLEDLLITQARGSRIVVTTRSNMVASIVRTNTMETHELRGLSNNECLDILVKWAFKEGDESKHPNLVNIAREIVKKCGGVPLAARTLGALLFSKKTNEHDWSSVRDSEMWALVQKENDILPILRLSYDQMPSYLKHCFAYCSLFEKDVIIYGKNLIYAWMALGFVQCADTKDELEDIGEGYILELERRSFLERACTIEYPLFSPVKREAYKMHDLVHDLAQLVAGNEFLTIKRPITEAIPETVRHVSFDLNTYCSFPRPLMEAKKLRTIVYPSNRKRMYRSPVEPAIASFRSLRVLEGRLPENIGKLKLLRYISTNAPTDLPNSLCMLLNLQYLDLSESGVSRLPEDFWKLISLRFLALSTTLTRLPKEGIGRLTSLRTLYFYECVNLESLGEGIEHLSCLRELILFWCKLVSLPAGIRHLTSLERLEIAHCQSLNLSEDDDLKGLRSLKTLLLMELPELVSLPLLDSAATLTHLDILGCGNFTSPSESVLPNLLSLQSLGIECCGKVASLPEGMQRLTKLHDLRILSCGLNATGRYREGGEDWPKIAHVPKISID